MDGILLIDKPEGLTSHDVVFKARKILGTKKIGHTGTLDPLATGLLVLMVGKATKLARYFSEHDKEYEAEILLGIETNTDDVTGDIINNADATKLSEKAIAEAMRKFVGASLQMPPNFSAIKVAGKKLYEYARNSQDMPVIEPRAVFIKSIDDIRVKAKEATTVTIGCSCHVSKGTYVRSLARDIGRSLGVYGTLKSLKRTVLGDFELKDATTLEALNAEDVTLKDPLKFLGMPELRVSEDIKKLIRDGRFLPLSLFKDKTETIIYDLANTPLAIYHYDKEINIMRMSVKLL